MSERERIRNKTGKGYRIKLLRRIAGFKNLPRGVFLVLGLALALMLGGLSGCRYSDTLFDVIIDQELGVLEPHATPEYFETEGAPEDSTKASVRLAENENLATQDAFLPVYREDAPADGQAIRRSYEEQTVSTNEAVEGDEMSDSEESNTASSDETESQEQEAAAENPEPTDEEENAEEGEKPEADKTSGRGGTGEVYGDGTYEELPDAQAVAAKGTYALIVQMLAGQGGLAAADAQWLDATAAREGIFPDEGVGDLDVVWDADGNLDLDALIASSADTLLVDGVSVSLTDAQKETLLGEGFNIVYVPVLDAAYTPDADIVTAVKVVGQILGGLNTKASYDTAAMAEQYIELHDTALEGCLNANGGYSYKMVQGAAFQGIYQGTTLQGQPTSNLSHERVNTACINSWASTSTSSITAKREFGFHDLYLNGATVDASDGMGLSAITVGDQFVLSDYYLQMAGVVNNAYDNAKPVSTVEGEQESLPYAVVPGSNDGLTARQLGVRNIPSALWFSEYGVSADSLWVAVGDESFPGIIVRDAAIAQNVVRSASKTNGLYNVGQPYDIYQVPAGVAGSWLDGNPESFLLSLWAYGVFQEHTLENAQEWIDGFYQLFYRVPSDGVSHLDGFGATVQAPCPVA